MLKDIEKLSQSYIPSPKTLEHTKRYELPYLLGLVGYPYIVYRRSDTDIYAYLRGLIQGKHYYLLAAHWKNGLGCSEKIYERANYYDKQEMDFLLYAIRYFDIADLKLIQNVTQSESIYMAANARLNKLLYFKYP